MFLKKHQTQMTGRFTLNRFFFNGMSKTNA